MDTLYIEKAIADHKRTLSICQRFPKARHIIIDQYGELFNSRKQNFRAQKKNPALILAHKHKNRLHETPPGYHIGGQHNYYFSHMFNCVYDCRYCFLQGMYQSGNYVFFVNTEDFFADIANTAEQNQGISWFFSGYDCDSLALDPVTGFVEDCLSFFSNTPQAALELRTKSTQIRPLLKSQALANVVVAFSLSPQAIISEEEHGTPSLDKRLDALSTLQQAGWPIGLRFDPLLSCENFESLYSIFFKTVANRLNMADVHSVSLGTFRLPKSFHQKLVRLYPDAKLLAAETEYRDGMVSYPEASDKAMREFCERQLRKYVPEDRFFPCS